MLKLITTQDGSHSLYREDLKETYHSFHGAKGESAYVFIEQCLDFRQKQNNAALLKIFEVGLGTGLNAWLSAIYARQHEVTIAYHTVEPLPVPEEIYRQLNYAEDDQGAQLLQEIHATGWGTLHQIHPYFQLIKYETTLEHFDQSSGFDCIYFDAFAPSKQAEMWSLPNFARCFELCAAGGVLSTYCAQGQFKRDLKDAGFEVETLKGALGKKEMVRGVRTAIA